MRPASATTLRRWAFAAAALACAIAASQAHLTVRRQLEEHKLGGYRGEAKVPPIIDLATKSLGCFRALAIIALWIRASDLQDQGKFFELNDLFRMISQLEPRFPGVWAYWAWNVAYNCSVKFTDPKDRWRWVSLGIEILRDRGIPINPNAPVLYRELAWLYNHKIGQDMDDAHIYYKVRLADLMQHALGKPPYLERLKAIAAAPATEADLLADPAVKALVAALKAAGADPFDKPLALANRDPALPPAALALLEEPAQADAAARLDAFLRSRHLRDELKLDVARMLKLMDFGPIDWRMPDAHSLYWAARSVELFGTNAFDAANADRILLHSLIELYRRGTLYFQPGTDDEPDSWIVAPNFAFLEHVVRLQEQIVQRHEKSDFGPPTREAFLNFLRDAVVNLFTYNDLKNATRYLQRLIELGGEPKMSLEEFVNTRYEQLLKGMTTEQAMNLISGFLFRSLMWASLGDTDRAVGEENMARGLYARYQDQHRAARFKYPTIRELWVGALRQALYVFRKYQLDELRRLYPNDLKAVEDELKKREAEREPARERQPERPPSPAPQAK